MALGLRLDLSNPARGLAFQSIERCPVRIGRDETVCNVVLEGDAGVSRLHASVDIRQGQIFVRDVQSARGTFRDGNRLEPDQWIALGALDREHELRISEWTVRIAVHELEGAGVDTTRVALGPEDATQINGLPIHFLAGADSPKTLAMPPPRAAAPSPIPHRAAENPVPPEPSTTVDLWVEGGRINALIEELEQRVERIRRALAADLESSEKKKREQTVDAFRLHFPLVADHPDIAPVLKREAPARLDAPDGFVTPYNEAFGGAKELVKDLVDLANNVAKSKKATTTNQRDSSRARANALRKKDEKLPS